MKSYSSERGACGPQKTPRRLAVTNVVATSSLGSEVDLVAMKKLRYVWSNHAVYPCAYVKTPTMRSTVSVFHSGKLISAGAKSQRGAQRDIAQAARYLADEGVAQSLAANVMVQNVVLTGSLGCPIDLAKLYRALDSSIYEPEQFPGLIHHPPAHPRTSILFFSSGRVVVAGVRSFRAVNLIEGYLDSIEALSKSLLEDEASA